MALKPNQRFGFCIPEGNYEIVRMLFVDKKGNIDIGVDLPKLSVLIEADHSNHIGALYLNMAGSTTTDSLIIPYKILSRPNEAAMMGVLGGAIGGALHAASISSQGIIGKHRLYVSRNEGTEEQAKLPVKYNYLTIHKAE